MHTRAAMNRPKTNSIKSKKSLGSTSTRSGKSSVVSGTSYSGYASEIPPVSSDKRRPQQQKRETATFGGGAGGPSSDDLPPYSEPNYQQTQSTLREQTSKASIQTRSSGNSVYTVASDSNLATALTHPAQAPKNAAAARAREQSQERRRVEDAKRQKERDASRERFERLALQAQTEIAKQDPDQNFFVERAERISWERAQDRGKRRRPEDRQRQ